MLINKGQTHFCLYFSLFALGLFTFYPLIGHDLLILDDYSYTNNIIINKGLTWTGFKWAFTTTFFEHWIPITWLSIMLDHQLYGANPAGFHFTNILLHLINSALVFKFLYLISKQKKVSWAIAILFCVHPTAVEPVAWVASRKCLLSVTFGLITLIIYFSKIQKNIKIPLAISTFCLSCLSKTSLVFLPLTFVFFENWQNNTESKETNFKKSLLKSLPFLLVSLVFLIIQSGITPNAANASLDTNTLAVSILNSAYYYFYYIGDIILKLNYNFFRSDPIINISTTIILIFFIILFTITFLTLLKVRKYPLIAAGWSCFLITLIPYVRIFKVGLQSVADRWQYFPRLGILIIVIFGIYAILSRFKIRNAFLPIIFSLILICSITSKSYIPFWKNSDTLLTYSNNQEENSHVLTMLALANKQNKETVLANSHLLRAIELDPLNDRAWKAVLSSDISVPLLDKILITLDNGDKNINAPNKLYQYLLCYVNIIYNDQARERYQQHLKLDPFKKANSILEKLKQSSFSANDIELTVAKLAYYNDQPEVSLELLNQALNKDPDCIECLNYSAIISGQRSDFPATIAQLKKIKRKLPQSTDIYRMLAEAYISNGQINEAQKEIAEGLSLMPGDFKLQELLQRISASRT